MQAALITIKIIVLPRLIIRGSCCVSRKQDDRKIQTETELTCIKIIICKNELTEKLLEICKKRRTVALSFDILFI